MRAMFNMVASLMLMLGMTVPVQAADNHYHITLLRASIGTMPAMIDAVKERKSALDGEMLIMRHSQGDHWDLMLLAPASEAFPDQANYQSQADFQHDFLATSDADWQTVKKMAEGANLFHVEMFQAASGLYDKLLEQRIMENNYLVATEREANLIFETRFGSDVDLFTLGIYQDMQAFAASPVLPPEAFEKAAVDAGFKARSDIGFYLRKFIIGHQDTLASQIE